MNISLQLAEKVLENEGVQTASQIWEKARPELATDQRYGRSPAIAMALTLAAESQRPGSDIHRIEGDPPTYCLQHVWLMTLSLEQALAATYADADKIAVSMTLKQIREAATKRSAKIAGRVNKRNQEGRAFAYGRERNPFIIAGARLRADYHCELCGDRGFERGAGELPYVEVHHLMRLADGGSDSFDNTAALCATCHRKMHFGAEREVLQTRLMGLRQQGEGIQA